MNLPFFPIAAWFQPISNFAFLRDTMGVNVVCGPELGNPPITNQAAWSSAAGAAGLKVILKAPVNPIPANCVGFMLTVDEPNGKGIPAAALKANFDALRALDPSLPIFLSLAGDKITSANFDKPVELQAYKDYAAVCDIFTVDVYPMNRNANHYQTTWPADAVKKLIAATGKPVWAWIECNDQVLDSPKLPDVNREPTPAEISLEANQAVAAGASGIGWFTTCQKASYKWPGSYLPMVNRAGASMSMQYRQCGMFAAAMNKPVPPLPVPRTLADVDQDLQNVKKAFRDLAAALGK